VENRRFLPSIIFEKKSKIRRQKKHFCKGVINLIKKPLGLLLSGVLTIGLAACNNGNDAADEVRTSRIDRDQTTLNVGNGRDDGIDHNGPLTEDYTNNDNNDSDWDRGTNNRNNNVTNVNNDRHANRIQNRNVNNDRQTNRTHNRNVNRNNVNVDNDNNNNDALNISADRTKLNSKNYPHTKAILIQHAQYRYIPFGSVQWYQFGGQQGKSPTQQQQQPTTQAPTQQQPTAPAPAAPAPKPAAPAPAPAAPAPKPAAPAPAPAAPAPKPAAPAPATGDVSAYVQQVIDLTNAERSKNGLPALKHDSQLSGVAQKKSVDMAQNNYFSHTSPTYGSPFDMMRDMGVSYKSAGENIAQGQRTPQEVVTAWMNSEGHRKNILSANFTHIGVGYEKSGNHWTQMFIGK
jgi:uncharacterized YkwD family protein